MDALGLQAIRHIFTMTVEESVKYIARDDNVAAWQQWKEGKKEIPDDVICIYSEVKVRRKLRINVIIDKINDRVGNNTMRFLSDSNTSRAAYHHDGLLDQKIYQSATVEFYAHDLERMRQEITTPHLFSLFAE